MCSRDHKLIEILADQQVRRAKQDRLFLVRNDIVHKPLSVSSLEEYSLAHRGERKFHSFTVNC